MKWPNWFRIGVGVVVTIVFIAAFLHEASTGEEIPTPLYTMMAMIVGAVFGSAALKGILRE